jgi:hypothetical protein
LPDGRQPDITISLKAGQTLQPKWTLNEIVAADVPAWPGTTSKRLRSRVAAIITTPSSARFSDVFVNRVWKRFMGTAFIEPVDAWTSTEQEQLPPLLRYLSWSFVDDGYDFKSLARKILTSKSYQQAAQTTDHENAFAYQQRRRLSAEQIVDSIHTAVGKDLGAEELTFDPNETRGFLNLGVPRRAWQMTSMSNERDRPALAMPVSQSIVDVLSTFGWRETRPDPITDRDESPNTLQPLMLANGLMSSRAIRLTEDSRITELCLNDISVEQLVDELYLTVLSRMPDSMERSIIVELISPDYSSRRTGKAKPKVVKRKRAYVDWDKHLKAEASVELLEAEKIVRAGEPPTVRLTTEFRERVEDALWCLINSPEFVFVP